MKVRNVAFAAGIAVLVVAGGSPASGATMGPWRLLLPGNAVSVAVTPSPVPGGPSVLLAGTLGGGASRAGVARSTDGGASWTYVLDFPAFSLAADPGNPSVVYAATPSGLYESASSGVAWTLLHPGIRLSIAVSPADSNLLYGDHRMSPDGGQSWTAMTGLPPFQFSPSGILDLPHVKIAPSNPSVLYAVVGDMGFRSANGGITWQPWDQADTVEIDPTAFPGAGETKHDGIDQDCNGYDLTIDVLLAEYDPKKLTLTVIATSRWGAAASLVLEDDKGPMTWVPNKGRWEITTGPIKGDPEFATVSGFEGSETVPTTRK